MPNLSAWRRGVTGDLTSALAIGTPADPTVPPLPDTSTFAPTVRAQVVENSLAGTDDFAPPYPPQTQNVIPAQETPPPRPTPPSPAARTTF